MLHFCFLSHFMTDLYPIHHLQDKVHIPGAIYLSVKFDSRCNTEEGCDELIMSSSSDFLQDVHNFSGTPQKWSDFEIPGTDLTDSSESSSYEK